MQLQAEQNNLKSAARIALIPLIIQLLGAIIFYKERVIFDGAYIAFQIINEGKLEIQVERYGSFITQIFPLITSKCHLPLKVVLISYSVSFPVFYLSTALILYRIRAYALVVLTGFYFTLYVSDTYFWTNNELHQGVCWMLLLFGLLYFNFCKQNLRHSFLRQTFNLLAFTILSFIAIYTHPSVMIPCGFLWGYYIIDNWHSGIGKKTTVIQSVILLAIIVFKYLTSTKNTYDSGFLTRLEKINIQDVLDTFTSGLADVIWKGYLFNYWFIPLLFIAGAIALCKKRKFLLLVFFAVANLAFFIVLCLLFSGGDTFYIESELMPFAILACTPFVYEVIPAISSRKKTVLLLSLIFAVRITFILFSVPKFTDRVEKIESMLQVMRSKNLTKMLVIRKDGDDRLEKDIIMSWALPYESIYLSALNGDNPQLTISYTHSNRVADLGKENLYTNMIFAFGLWSIPMMNKQYFNIDTIQDYTTVKYEEFPFSK